MYLFFFIAKEAKLEWSKLRENFRKCLKRREVATRSGSGKTQLPSCQFFKELLFIKDTVSNRPTSSNVPLPDLFTPPPSPGIESATVTSENSSIMTTAATPVLPVVTSGRSNTSTSSTSKRKKDSDELNTLLMASIKRDLSSQTSSSQSSGSNLVENDPDKAFCLSLVEELKSLAPCKKRLARVKMLQVLCEAHED